MLYGGFDSTLDTKGRAVLPTKLRSGLGETFHFMKGFGSYVAIYPDENYEKMLEQLMNMKKTSDEYLALARHLLGSAFDGELDGNGRILIPPVLRKFAGLDKDIHIIGVGDHIEIWDSETYEKENIMSSEYVDKARECITY